jgi:translation initiation factor 2 subunit 3
MSINLSKPIFNIGALGAVSDGKSTTVFQLTGTKTQRNSNEVIRNITIKPGYANMKIWQNSDGSFVTTNSETTLDDATLVHHLSFVDCPGHQEYIFTMMGSVSLMKGAIVVVSAAEPISKKPQLIQHLAAAKMAGLNKLVIIFNKLDLITKEKAIERKEELDELLAKLNIKPNYIIPTALNKRLGLQNVIKAIMDTFPPISDTVVTDTPPEFKITRSFDINKPGSEWNELKGGVIGGSLINGILKIGDDIEIRPGTWKQKKDGTFIINPIRTKILSLQTDKISLDILTPGGLTSIGTDIDPYYSKDDNLSGNIIGLVGQLPNIYDEISIDFKPTTEFDGVWDPDCEKNVYLQIGNTNTKATLIDSSIFKFKLSKPACIQNNALILVCTCDEGDTLKICGYGNLQKELSNIIL